MHRVSALLILLLFESFNLASQDLPMSSPENAGRIIHNADNDQGITVFTYSRRPLQEAIRLINDEYGWGIDYEDAPTVNVSEIVDEDGKTRTENPKIGKNGYFPKGEPFESKIKDTGDSISVMKKLITDYNNSSNPGRYDIEHTAKGALVVVGTSYTAELGKQKAAIPVMSCRITVSIIDMDLESALKRVADAVNTSCSANLKAEVNADYAAEILGPLAEAQVSGSYRQKAARDVVEDLIAQQKGLLHYTLEYVPVVNKFYLEIWLTRRKITNEEGVQIVEPVPRK